MMCTFSLDNDEHMSLTVTDEMEGVINFFVWHIMDNLHKPELIMFGMGLNWQPMQLETTC